MSPTDIYMRLVRRKGSAPHLTHTTESEAPIENMKHFHVSKAWTAGEADPSRSSTPPSEPAEPKRETKQAKIVGALVTRTISCAAILEKTTPHAKKKPDCGTNSSLSKQTETALRQILDLLKEQQHHSSPDTRNCHGDDHADRAVVEWQMVAMVIDRVMLAVFALLIVVAYTVIFSRIPT